MKTGKLQKIFITHLMTLISVPLSAASIDAVIATGSGIAATSTGQIELSITKGDAVAISGISGTGGITITGQNAGSDKTGFIEVCTYVTTATYQLEINSFNTVTSEFDASDGLGNLIPFSVLWDDGTNAWTFSNNTGVAQTGNTTTISTSDPVCAGGTNTTITVTVRNSDFNKVPRGNYSDTLAIIIAAQ
ncbi:MAG: hypothetical protein GQ583_00200 [Methyloprofundus sp.]|nr:hypothetical protein [Methyloprofundus sp.]